jgi:hypothetical protein
LVAGTPERAPCLSQGGRSDRLAMFAVVRA